MKYAKNKIRNITNSILFCSVLAMIAIGIPYKGYTATPPNTPIIYSPTNSSTFNGGDSITFSGSCTDSVDGILSGSSLVWISSKNGQIGTGQNFSIKTLQSGLHTITLIATNSQNQTSTASVNITVGNNPPTATILLPASDSSYSYGTTITFSGAGTDIDTGETLSYSWTSTMGGTTTPIGTGPVISVSNLSVGTHVIILIVNDGNGGLTASAPRLVTITNSAPIATIVNPKNNDTFYTGTTINFIGTGIDAEDSSNSLTYQWSSNDAGVLSNSASFSTNSLTPGYHTITFKVTDTNGTSNIAPQTITIHVGNFPPTASITNPATGTSYNFGQSIVFKGTGSDTEDGSLSGANLVWTSSLMGVTPIGTGNTFVVNNLKSGTHVITLTVTDNGNPAATSTATTIISINNTFPTATISYPGNGDKFYPGANITFAGVGNDAEDGALTGASLVWKSNLVGIIGTGSPLAINTLPEGTHIITLTATDSGNASTISTPVTITIGNSAPTVSIVSPSDGSTFNQGDTITFKGSSTDAEDGTLSGASLTWTSSVNGLIGTGTILPISTLSMGVHTITLKATDSQGKSTSTTITVSVINSKPVVIITSPPNNGIYANGTSLTLSGTATDKEDGVLTGTSVTWSSNLDGALGTGSSLSGVVLTKGSHIITMTATDSGGLSTSATVQVHIGNTPPTATIISPMTGTHFAVGENIFLHGSGSDAEDGTLTGTSLVWISNISGEIATGENPSPINNLPVGRHTISLVATDSSGAVTYSTPISIRVGNTPPVPTILLPANNTTFAVGQNITFVGTGVDTEDGVLLGASLVWTSNRQGQIGTGNSLTLTNLVSGPHVITLTVTDLDGTSSSTSINIKAQNHPPAVNITAPASGTSFDEGSTIAFQGTGNDTEDGTLSGTDLVWSSNLDGNLGTGTNLSIDTLSGGTHAITLKATDHDGSSTVTTITVMIVPMTVSPTTLTITAGGTGTFTITGGKSPYRIATRRSQIATATESNGTVTVNGISPGGTVITVTDNKKKSKEVLVTVTSPDIPPSSMLPEAYAGPDQTQIKENSLVHLTGQNLTDLSGKYTAYLWTQMDPDNPTTPLAIPTVTLSNPASSNPTFTSPLVDINGPVLLFQLTAITTAGTSTDQVYIYLQSNGISGFPPGVVRFKASTGRNMGAQLTGGGMFSMVTAMDPTAFESSTRPQNMFYGLISMKIISLSAGETAVITIFLPEAAPPGYSWFKYIKSQDTWIDFDRNLISNGKGDGAVFSADRKTVTLYITDDGPYDDNKKDGIIEDPSGLGIGPLVSNTGSSNEGKNGGGCFIDSLK